MALDFGPPLEQIFEALGQEATYVDETGAQKVIMVLPRQPDVISDFQRSPIQSSTLTLEVLTADVEAFQKGKDKIIFKGITYIVQGAQIADALKLVWMVDTHPEEED